MGFDARPAAHSLGIAIFAEAIAVIGVIAGIAAIVFKLIP